MSALLFFVTAFFGLIGVSFIFPKRQRWMPLYSAALLYIITTFRAGNNMLFNSINFAFFFIVITTIYFLLEHRYRWLLLLVASCYFYMVFIPVYVLILALLIIIDYAAARFIERSQGNRRTLFLIFSIFSTCLALFVFKYFNFFNANFTHLAQAIHWNYSVGALSLILPIGLSFHTFQSLSYVIEVYRGKQKAERHFGIYALYVMFYPQLVAGPIERPQNLLHQFYEKHRFEFERVTSGLRLMLWGLFKKVVVADRLAIVVSAVYADPTIHSSTAILIATVFFAFQIYCDFSGYSDIARGAARVMGFNLMVNFDRPYIAKSISEFWRRWHISLSSWFKDYVYIPLGGNRVSVPRWYLNLLVVFIVSGLWHGANWTFVIWGALHGAYLVFAIIIEKPRAALADMARLTRVPLLHNAFKMLVVFILVCIGWVFFRAKSVSDALYVLTRNFTHLTPITSFDLGVGALGALFCFALIFFLFLMEWLIDNQDVRAWFFARATWLRWSAYVVFIIFIMLFGIFAETPFIYFQF